MTMERCCKFTVTADTHYYDASLGISGGAYALRSGSDQKCLAETGAILDAAFAELAQSDTQAVLIAGDLTNNGECVCHEGLRKKLYDLQKSKPVYVTTATHDWCCDQNPRRFQGDCVFHDVPTVRSEQLYDLYADFGTARARKAFQTHLGTASYLADLGEEVVLLALIDDQNGKGRAGYAPDHLAWILDTIRTETAAGKTVFAMQHHLLYPHISPLVTGGACCGAHEALCEVLAEAGLRFLFVGHSHLHRTDRFVSSGGRELYEINVGSLVGYPAPMVEVTVYPDTVELRTKRLESFVWNGKSVDAQLYLRAHAAHVLCGIVDTLVSGTKQAAAARLSALGLDGAELMRKYGAVIRGAARYFNRATVGELGCVLRRLPGGACFQKEDLAALQNASILEIVCELLLTAMSGDAAAKGHPAAYGRVLAAAGTLPARLLSALHIRDGRPQKLCREAERLLHELATGGDFNNNCLVIPRCQGL